MVRNQRTVVAPSVLSANFAHMADAIDLIERSGGDWVHLDVMDGAFVPNLTFGPKMVSDLRPLTKLPFDVHLMVERPQQLIPAFAEAGADIITFHYEAVVHSHRVLEQIHGLGKRAGISLVPSTNGQTLSELFPYLDLILIMTVNPGFGGQEMIPECVEKVRYLADVRRAKGYRYRLAVDGGINEDTVAQVHRAGADVIVAGSAFFGADDPARQVGILRGNKSV
jgi:ribulose-phosphate 3-epimerase